jgi:cyclopropane fatty-acyl-phospholipid synthase-like methyltransferase
MSSMYQDGTYLERNPTWHEEEAPWRARMVLQMLQKHAIKPRTVCEVGCGAGGVLEQLSLRLPADTRFEGFEISPQAYELCLPKQEQNLVFHLGELPDDRSRRYDLLLALDVFEHVEDYLAFLRKIKRAAAFKILHIPLDLSVQTVLRSTPIMTTRSQFGHLHYFTKETSLATLEYAGYEVLDYVYTGISVDLPRQDWRARLMRWPRKLLFALNRDLTVRFLGGYSLLVLAK